MKNNETKITTDIQKFIDKFEPTKFKVLSRGIEVRGTTDIHSSIAYAKALIENMKLRLAVHHSAEMVTYGGFEVVNL